MITCVDRANAANQLGNIRTSSQHTSCTVTISRRKEEFIAFFQEKKINFAWTYSDMPGLDHDLIMCHLSITLGVKIVKQKLRKMHPHVAFLIKAELENILKVSFI